MIDFLYYGWFSIPYYLRYSIICIIVLIILRFIIKKFGSYLITCLASIVKGALLCVLFVISIMYEVLAFILVKINSNLVFVKIEQWFSKTILKLKSNWNKKYNITNKLNWLNKNLKITIISLAILLSFLFYRFDDKNVVTIPVKWGGVMFEELFQREVATSSEARKYFKNLKVVQKIKNGNNLEEVSSEEVPETYYLKPGVNTANIRSEASFDDDKIIETAYPEQPLIYLHQSMDNGGVTWYYIQLPNGIKGWISSNIIESK